MSALREIPDKGANLQIRYIGFYLLARLRIRGKIQMTHKGRIHQDDLPLSIGYYYAAGKRFDDGTDTTFFRVQVNQGPFAFQFKFFSFPGKLQLFHGPSHTDTQLVG